MVTVDEPVALVFQPDFLRDVQEDAEGLPPKVECERPVVQCGRQRDCISHATILTATEIASAGHRDWPKCSQSLHRPLESLQVGLTLQLDINVSQQSQLRP